MKSENIAQIKQSTLRTDSFPLGLFAWVPIGLFVLSFFTRLFAFLQSPHPYGFDGYYYVTQVQWFLNEGRIHTPDASWPLWLFNLLGFLTHDPILAVKIGSSILVALAVPAAWYLGKTLGGRNAGFILAMWALASPTLSHLNGDFPKVSGMIPCLYMAIAFMLTRPRTWLRISAATVFALLASSAHRVGLFLILGSTLALLASESRVLATKRRAIVALGLAALLGLSVALGLSFFPNLLHISDFTRIDGHLSFSLFPMSPWSFFSLRETSVLQQMELISCWGALLIGIVGLWRWPHARRLLAVFLLPLAMLIAPVWRADELDMGYRLWLIAPAFAVPIFALVVGRFPFPKIHRAIWISMGLASTLLAVLAAPTGLDADANPPYERYKRMIEAIPRPFPERVIVHQGVNFYFGYLTGHYGIAWAPGSEMDRTAIYRLAWGIRPEEWFALTPGTSGAPRLVTVDPDYTYVREDVWEGFVEAAIKDDDDDLLGRIFCWRNPMRMKPDFLRRNWE